MESSFLNSIKKTHFVGIGGIGVSAVARMMILRGAHVTGSDRSSSNITELLAGLGAEITLGHSAAALPDDTDLVVYSPAIPEENPELVRARELKIPTYSYPEMLGKISEGMRTIAVAGTHGKTTTTGMIAGVLIDARKSPTVIVGSLLRSGSNFIPGTSNLFVVEACEYKRSFLNLSPEILIITNIDNDHLDYYKDIDDIISAFRALAMKVPSHGVIVADINDANIKKALEGVPASVMDYCEMEARKELSLAVPGDHNVRNACSALAVAQILDISIKDALISLASFQGTWRRQEKKGETTSGVIVYDDYAHHPTEIRATLQGFKAKYPESRIRAVFQPHLYSRTRLLMNDFVQSFGDASEVIIAPIYAAREEMDDSVSSEKLVEAMKTQHKNVRYGGDFSAIVAYLRETAVKGDIIITMGAGDIAKVGEDFLK